MNRKIFFVMPFVLLALIIGSYNGLLRIGWDLPYNKAMAQHGAIMVGSFLGTLILLERVVIFRKAWLYIFPIINGMSIFFFLTGRFILAMDCLLIGAVATSGIYFYLYHRHRETFLLIMLIGALSLIGGYIMLLHTHLYPTSVPFWIAFILLTIIGERLELTKFLPPGRLKIYLLLFSIMLYFVGLYFDFHGPGQYLIGSSLVIFSAWLLFYDIAFKSVRLSGLHRYIAVNLIAGYAWLFVTGCLLMLTSEMKFIYDAILHAFFLGFTFSMILAHGPIILPGVAGIARKPFHPVLYLWGAILQVSLAARVIGDFYESLTIREISGLVNMIAILGFFLNVLVLMKFSNPKSQVPNSKPQIPKTE